MLINAFSSKKNPYIPPPPWSAAVSSEQPSGYPTTFPARASNSTEVMDLSRVSLGETELINAFSSKKYPYIPPPPESAAVSSEQPSGYPTTLPARAFNSTEVMDLPRVSLGETELNKYQRLPELLQKETFVFFNEDKADYEAFRIPMLLLQVKIECFTWYGPEAVAFSSIDLFDLLRTSKLVRN
jgi:hypothetical protein